MDTSSNQHLPIVMPSLLDPAGNRIYVKAPGFPARFIQSTRRILSAMKDSRLIDRWAYLCIPYLSGNFKLELDFAVNVNRTKEEVVRYLKANLEPHFTAEDLQWHLKDEGTPPVREVRKRFGGDAGATVFLEFWEQASHLASDLIDQFDPSDPSEALQCGALVTSFCLGTLTLPGDSPARMVSSQFDFFVRDELKIGNRFNAQNVTALRNELLTQTKSILESKPVLAKEAGRLAKHGWRSSRQKRFKSVLARHESAMQAIGRRLGEHPDLKKSPVLRCELLMHTYAHWLLFNLGLGTTHQVLSFTLLHLGLQSSATRGTTRKAA